MKGAYREEDLTVRHSWLKLETRREDELVMFREAERRLY